MEGEIISSEFRKLPLEERAKTLLKNYHTYNDFRIKHEGNLLSSVLPFLETWIYVEEQKYVELVGGTAKSGAAYRITEEGHAFMDKE